MANRILARGLALIQYALIAGDGTVGSSWRDFGLTDRDSDVTLVEGDPTQDPVYSHELDPALDYEYTAGDMPLIFSLVASTLQQRALLLGGIITGTGDAAVLSIPSTRVPLEVAIRILPRKGELFTANRVQIWAKANKNWAKSSKWVYDATGNILQPYKDGVPFMTEGPQVATIRGAVGTGSIESAGTGYTVGTFTGVPLVNLAGEGAIATIVVAAGAVTTVTITAGGKGYHKGSILTAPSLAGGSGFEWLLEAIA